MFLCNTTNKNLSTSQIALNLNYLNLSNVTSFKRREWIEFVLRLKYCIRGRYNIYISLDNIMVHYDIAHPVC